MKRTIVGLSGLAGSGKSTAAKEFVDAGYELVKFAGPLKRMLVAIGLTYEEIEGSLKEQPCDLLMGCTPRYAMQTLGTEWGRNIIDPELWVNAWKNDVNKLPLNVPVVTDDVRFENEAAMLRSLGGIIIRIERPNGRSTSAGNHVSEAGGLFYEATVHNKDTLDSFKQLMASWARSLAV